MLNFAGLIAEGLARDLTRPATRQDVAIALRHLGAMPKPCSTDDVQRAWEAAMVEIQASSAGATSKGGAR